MATRQFRIESCSISRAICGSKFATGTGTAVLRCRSRWGSGCGVDGPAVGGARALRSMKTFGCQPHDEVKFEPVLSEFGQPELCLAISRALEGIFNVIRSLQQDPAKKIAIRAVGDTKRNADPRMWIEHGPIRDPSVHEF